MVHSPPQAFLSYARSDNGDGRISTFRKELSNAAKLATGQSLEIFMDLENITAGERWSSSIDKVLNKVNFFIPILTPSYFNSKYCRDELSRFLASEAELGRQDLIFPVYYIRCSVLEESQRLGHDDLARTLAERHHVDWRELRFKRFSARVVRQALEGLARNMSNRTTAIALTRPHRPVRGLDEDMPPYLNDRQEEHKAEAGTYGLLCTSSLELFQRPMRRNEIRGMIFHAYDLVDDEITDDSFDVLAEERKKDEKKSPFNQVMYRVIGKVEYNLRSAITIPVAQITYAHFALPERPETRERVSRHISRKLSNFKVDNGSSLHMISNTVPLGVEVAIISRDQKILMVRRSRHVQTAADQWDVSFSGYANARDVSQNHDGEFVDFWSTAIREAHDELKYHLEARALVFHGIHHNVDTGAMDLVGTYKSQREAEYIKSRWRRKSAESEMDGAEVSIISATPIGIAEFCEKRGILFGAREERAWQQHKRVLMPEAAACLIFAMKDLNFSGKEIATAIKPYCDSD